MKYDDIVNGVLPTPLVGIFALHACYSITYSKTLGETIENTGTDNIQRNRRSDIHL